MTDRDKVERRQPVAPLARDVIENIYRLAETCDQNFAVVSRGAALSLCEMALAYLDRSVETCSDAKEQGEGCYRAVHAEGELRRLRADRKAVIEECAKVCDEAAALFKRQAEGQSLGSTAQKVWVHSHTGAASCADRIRALAQTGGKE